MSNINIKPVGHRILVQRLESQEQSVGGIILPETNNQEKPSTARVIEVGRGFVGEHGRIPLPINVEIGDTLLLTRHAGVEVKHEGEKYYLITPEDVLAIVY